jgi:hypothetical protein
VTRFVSDKSISVHGEDYLMWLGLSLTSLFLFMLKIIWCYYVCQWQVYFCSWWRLFDVTRFVTDKSISVHAEDYLMWLGLSLTSLFLFMLKIIWCDYVCHWQVYFCSWWRLFDVTRFVTDKSISVHGEDYLMWLGLSLTSLFLFMLKIIWCYYVCHW